MRILLFAIAFLLSIKSFSQPCNMQGVYKIGPGGNYATITAALTALRSNGVGGPVILEIKSNYINITESVFFANIPCVSAANTITLRPEAGAVNVKMSSVNSILFLSNSKYTIIDGRPGGTGTVSQLSIACTGATNNAIVFSDDAANNIVQYVNISGVNTSANNGAVVFLTGGNTNNIIRNCKISGNSSGYPLNCIYAESTAAKNTGNKIQDCSITGFNVLTTGSANGIFLGKNNEGWEISANSFYQDPAASGPGDVNAICINDTTSANTITGNYIGGSAPLCSGNPYQVNGRFNGIIVAGGKNSYTSIQNNTIQNIRWTMSLSSGGVDGFAGIHILSGKVNCGDVTGNTIGNMTQNESIYTTSAYLDNPSVTGILVGYNPFNTAVTDSLLIKNNKIGGIKCMPSATNYFGTVLRGIHVAEQKAGFIDISNNTIGSTTLNSSLDSRVMTNGAAIGIELRVSTNGPLWSDTYPINNRIADNKISHFYGTSTGIKLFGGKPQVLNNAVTDFDMSTSSMDTLLSINCISVSGALSGTVIKGNHFYNLSVSAQQASGIQGILLDLCNGVEVSKNFIHSFQMSSTNGTGIVTGIEASPSVTNLSITNNMISLGVDLMGNTMNRLNEYNGIKAAIDTSIITHNSVYIAGTGDRSANALNLIKKNNSVCRVTNNILMNMHSQATANVWTFNYAVVFEPLVTTTLSGLVMSNNLYRINGVNSFTGGYNNSRYLSLASWQSAISNDNDSQEGDPNFIAPAANTATTNLHFQIPKLANLAGIIEQTVTHDFDDELRSVLTPVDIGADAILSVPQPVIFSFTPASAPSGTTVTINGTEFTGASSVKFGGVSATSFNVLNASTLTAVVSIGATGTVEVTTPGGVATKTGFTYETATALPFSPIGTPAEITATPNPGNGIILIKHPSSAKAATLQFFDIAGRKVKEVAVAQSTSQTEVNVNSFPPSVYYIIWNNGNRKLSCLFLIK